MSPRRRRLLALLAGAGSCAAIAAPTDPVAAGAQAATDRATDAPGRAALDADDRIDPGRALRFPRDHGAHPSARIEWWYATGWLEGAAGARGTAGGAPVGFQVTFFRSRTGLAEGLTGRFAPRQLLFAHAALTDLGAGPHGRHHHAQQVARWSGDESQRAARATRADTDVALGRWLLRREAAPAGGGAPAYVARVADDSRALAMDLRLQATQPVLLQGQAGWSRKGPALSQASHYYSQPQLAVRGRITLDGRTRDLAGSGWLDHEWSDQLMPADAVGWDWIGINLADGGALTAFRLRRRDGSVAWAGGSHRPAGAAVRAFGPDDVRFEPLRRWRSPQSGADYPVQWRVVCPAGRFELRALLDGQELDSRGSTGAVYWEGLSDLLDDQGRRVGRGYLEMTGYVAPLRL